MFNLEGMSNIVQLHPGRLTWNLKMMVWKMIFLFNWVVVRFHVNLPGCKWWVSFLMEHEYILDLGSPSQDASHHQDEETFLGSGLPN